MAETYATQDEATCLGHCCATAGCIGYDRLANAQTCNIYTGCTTYDTSADAQWRWADVTGAAAADGCAAGTYQAAATSEATRVCGSFAVHARVSVNFNGGQSTVHGGDVGVSPGTVVDGTYVFEGGGSVVDASDGVFANKVLDEHAAAIAARADGVAMASEIGGVTFTPGTYRSTTINLAAGTVTLDGQNQSNPVFLFQATTTLVTAASTSIILTNGAKAENVLWALGTAATLGASSVLQGSILAGTLIAFGTSAELRGCALAQTAVTFAGAGSVTLPSAYVCTACPAGTYNNTIGASACAACPVATYSAAGAATCTACATGSTSVAGSVSVSACSGGCAAGYTGVSGGGCVECVAGTYKVNTGSAVCDVCAMGLYSTTVGAVALDACLVCPAHTRSDAGSDELTDCSCVAGYTGPDGGGCVGCVAGTYKVGNGSGGCDVCGVGTYSPTVGAVAPDACLVCPAHTRSDAGSDALTDCSCVAGYTGVSGGGCVGCAAGTYKVGNGSAVCDVCAMGFYSTTVGAVALDACLGCPAHTRSDAGSDQLTDCSCVAGYTGQDGVGCVGCVAGTYKVNTGSAVCSLCATGLYSTTVGAVAPDTCLGCPAHSRSDEGSDELTDCSCVAGYTGPDGGGCVGCVAGTYKVNNGAGVCVACGADTYTNTVPATSASMCVSCPAHTTSAAGSGYITSCSCVAGYTGADGAPCSACAAGTFKTFAGNATCEVCPANAESASGSVVCQCAAGFSGDDGGPCLVCAVGEYKGATGASACTPCPAHATAPAGSLSLDACTCEPGYIADAATCLPDVVMLSPLPRFCELPGGSSVSLQLPRDTFLADTPTFATFWDAPDALQVALQVTPGGLYTASCPPIASGRASGTSTGFLLTAAGVRVAAFTFRYERPPSLVSPHVVASTGGTVNLTLYEVPAAFPAGCKVLFGAREGGAVTVLRNASSEGGGVTSDPSVFATLVVTTAPSSNGTGTVAVALQCAAVAEGQAVAQRGAFLQYIETPSITQAAVQGDACAPYLGCRLVVTIRSPPATVADVTHLGIALSGVPFLATAATSRAQILSLSDASLTLLILIPPPTAPGNITIRIAPLVALPGFTTAQFAVSTRLEIVGTTPVVRKLYPSSAFATGGETVEVHVAGFPPISNSSDINLTLGGITLTPSLLYSEARYAGLAFTAPEIAAGVTTLRVQHTSSPSAVVEAEFIVKAVGLTAVCASGCSAAVEGGASATFLLGGFLGVTLTTQLAADVRGAAAPVTALTTAPGGLSVTVTLPASSTNGAPFAVQQLRFAVSADAARFAYAQVTYYRAPLLAAARFNAIGSQLILTFDQATSGTGAISCAASLQPNSTLGTSPSCTWSSPTTLTVALGAGATVLPAAAITWVGIGLKSANLASFSAGNSSTLLLRSAYAEPPTLMVVGSNEIGTCDVAKIQVFSTSPRPLTYRWGCRSHPDLNANFSSETSDTLMVAGHALTPQTPYQITVSAESFLGGISDEAIHYLTVLDAPPPLLSIEMPPAPYARPADIWVNAAAQYSACAPDESARIAFSWTLTPGSAFDPNTAILQTTGAELRIPRDTLLPGGSYHLQLYGRLDSGEPSAAARIFTVGFSALVAGIAGGSRTVSRDDDAVVLDGSASRDPDVCPPSEGACPDDAMTFAWACRLPDGSPCRLKTNAELLLANTAIISVDMAALSLAEDLTLTFTLTVQKLERFQEATVVLMLEDGEVAQVSVDRLSVSATRVAFAGASEAADATFLWDIQGPGIEARRRALILLNLDFSPTGDAAPTLVVNLRPPAALATLTPGAAYTVTLRATSPTRGNGATSTTFTLPLPPSGGACGASPPVGDAYTGEFTLACENWASDELPLEYAYGVVLGGFSEDGASWSAPSYVATYTFILPPGSYTASVRVSDALGATALATPSSIVAATPGGNATGVDQAEAGFQAATLAMERMAALGQGSRMFQAAGAIAEALLGRKGLRREGGGLRREGGWVTGGEGALSAATRRLLLPDKMAPSFNDKMAPPLQQMAPPLQTAPSVNAGVGAIGGSPEAGLAVAGPEVGLSGIGAVGSGLAGVGAIGSGRRASSAAYRMRTRRMLLRTVSASTSTSISARTARAALGATATLTSNPAEVDADAVGDAGAMLAACSIESTLTQLQGGSLGLAVALAQSLVASMQVDLDLPRKGANLMTVITSLKRLAGTYGDGMTVGEAPWVLTTEHVSVAVIRAPPGASSISSTAWESLGITVTLARPAARRHAHAPGGDPASFVTASARDVTSSTSRDVSSAARDVTSSPRASRDSTSSAWNVTSSSARDVTTRRAALFGDTTLTVIHISDAPAMVAAPSTSRLSYGATGVFVRDSAGESTDQAAGPARCPGGAFCIKITVKIRILGDQTDEVDPSEKARAVLEEKVLFIRANVGISCMLLVGPGPQDWSDRECVASRAVLYAPLNRTGEVECSCRAEGMVQVVWDRPPPSVLASQAFEIHLATLPFIQHAPLFAVWFVYLEGGITALLATLFIVLYFPRYMRKFAALKNLAWFDSEPLEERLFSYMAEMAKLRNIADREWEVDVVGTRPPASARNLSAPPSPPAPAAANARETYENRQDLEDRQALGYSKEPARRGSCHTGGGGAGGEDGRSSQGSVDGLMGWRGNPEAGSAVGEEVPPRTIFTLRNPVFLDASKFIITSSLVTVPSHDANPKWISEIEEVGDEGGPDPRNMVEKHELIEHHFNQEINCLLPNKLPPSSRLAAFANHAAWFSECLVGVPEDSGACSGNEEEEEAVANHREAHQREVMGDMHLLSEALHGRHGGLKIHNCPGSSAKAKIFGTQNASDARPDAAGLHDALLGHGHDAAHISNVVPEIWGAYAQDFPYEDVIPSGENWRHLLRVEAYQPAPRPSPYEGVPRNAGALSYGGVPGMQHTGHAHAGRLFAHEHEDSHWTQGPPPPPALPTLASHGNDSPSGEDIPSGEYVPSGEDAWHHGGAGGHGARHDGARYSRALASRAHADWYAGGYADPHADAHAGGHAGVHADAQADTHTGGQRTRDEAGHVLLYDVPLYDEFDHVPSLPRLPAGHAPSYEDAGHVPVPNGAPPSHPGATAALGAISSPRGGPASGSTAFTGATSASLPRPPSEHAPLPTGAPPSRPGAASALGAPPNIPYPQGMSGISVSGAAYGTSEPLRSPSVRWMSDQAEGGVRGGGVEEGGAARFFFVDNREALGASPPAKAPFWDVSPQQFEYVTAQATARSPVQLSARPPGNYFAMPTPDEGVLLGDAVASDAEEDIASRSAARALPLPTATLAANSSTSAGRAGGGWNLPEPRAGGGGGLPDSGAEGCELMAGASLRSAVLGRDGAGAPPMFEMGRFLPSLGAGAPQPAPARSTAPWQRESERESW